MRKGNVEVEQVNKEGEIVKGVDEYLTTKELYEVISKYFPNVERDKSHPNYIICKTSEKTFLIRTKNITYLGNPHKLYKKRLQLPKDIPYFYQYAKKNKFCPLIVGVYSHDDLRLFVDFSIETFVSNKSNNSSAHVYTSDLQKVLLHDDEEETDVDVNYGYFEKVDRFGNRVTVFDTESVTYYLNERELNQKTAQEELVKLQKKVKAKGKKAKRVTRLGRSPHESKYIGEFKMENLQTYGSRLFSDDTRNIILNYFVRINKNWNGIDCYRSMFADNYRNMNQAEWAGFYLEYTFEKYLVENDLIDKIHYAQDKCEGGIDLDLYISELQTYGDLKAHSSDNKDIPGNKQEAIMEVLNKSGEVVYIVCVHDTEKDSDHDLEVTHYWNAHKTNRKKRQNPNSYSKRMKNSVTLKRVEILSINSQNVDELKAFRQGKNSNGKPRKVKVMIDGEKISKFRRLSYSFE